MNMYRLRKIGISALSVLLALSITGFVAGVTLVVLFQSNDYVTKRVNENKTELIGVIDETLASSASELGLSEDAFKGAINDENISVVSSEIAKNIMYSYTTDFSDSTALYNEIASKYSEYISTRHLTYSSNKVDMDASYAASRLSEALYCEDTTEVLPFKIVHQKLALYLVTASVVMIIVSCVAIELANKGRHRKYSYYGMGVVMSGYFMSVIPLFVVASGLVDKYKFTDFTAYDNAITACVEDALKLIALFGILFIAAGVVILILNYNYFKKKNEKAQESRDIKKKLRDEYRERFMNEKNAQQEKGRKGRPS